MNNCTDVVIEQSDLPKIEIPSSYSNIEQTMLEMKTTPPNIEISTLEEVTSENGGKAIEIPSMTDKLKNMNTSDSSWLTTTDTSVNSSPTQSLLENCDGLDSASLASNSPPLVRRVDASESSWSTSSTTEYSDDSYSSSNYCSCSSCSDCGGCKCSCSSDQTFTTSFESTDDLTNKPRAKRGSPLNKKDAKKINERCSQS